MSQVSVSLGCEWFICLPNAWTMTTCQLKSGSWLLTHDTFHFIHCHAAAPLHILSLSPMWTLKCFFNCTVLLHSLPFCLVHTDVLLKPQFERALWPKPRFVPLDQTLSAFYYSWFFEGLYTVNVTWRGSNANHSLLTVLFQWHQSWACFRSYSMHIRG